MIALSLLTRFLGMKSAGIGTSRPTTSKEGILSLEEFGARLRKSYAGPLMATDTLIQWPTHDHVVLIERKYPPYGLAIPGGFAERMLFHENAIKEAVEETGLSVDIYNPDRPFIYLAQDPREYIKTAVFIGKGSGELLPKPDEDAVSARTYHIDELEEIIGSGRMAFKHHERILAEYTQRHRRYTSIAQDDDHLRRLWRGDL